MDHAQPQGLPTVGVSNGESLEFGYADMDGELHFAAGDPAVIGPGAIDPQDAQRLLDQIAPVVAVTYGDITDNEFDQYLTGKDGLAVYHQMLTDGTVANALQYIYGSLRSANWTIEPASDDDQDIEMAAFVADQLGLDDMSPNKYPFGRLFTLFEQSLIYGMVFGEIVLAQGADGKALLDKIIPISPFAVDEVKFDNMGGPDHLVVNGTVRGTGKQVQNKKIPIWKTIAFVNKDDGTFNGRSFLRAAVAHWRVKRSLVVLINQGLERFLLGVPVIKVPKHVKPGTKQWTQAQMVAKNFITKPRLGVVLPPGWEFEVAKLPVSMPEARPYLEYHDAAIARALGIDFNTVTQNTGIQNLNIQAFIGLTENTIETLAKDFASAVNLYLIPKLCVLNWPEARRYPRLTFNLKVREDFSAAANLMGMLVNAALSAGGTTSTDAEGKQVTTPATPEQVGETLKVLMGVLPPRFKRALGIDEMELQARLNEYRAGASTAYSRDRRKPLPGGGR